MTNGGKRLIANWIAGISITVMIASLVPGAVENGKYHSTINDLSNQQNNIYKSYMKTSEFSSAIDSQIIQLADDYTSGRIDYEKFRDRLEAIFSIENAKQALNLSNSDLKSQAEDIDKLLKYEKEKHEASIIPELSASGMAIGGVSALTASMTLGGFNVYDRIKKRKNQKNNDKTLSH